jgi:shikimate dehydrogenase
MRLALLGYPISHSLSPKIYNELLGNKLASYELLEIQNPADIPTLFELSKKLDGLSITAPHKKHFLKDKIEISELVKNVGAINTLFFKNGKVLATNTDVLATKIILERFQITYPKLKLILLGNGSMAKLTKILASQLGIPLIQKFRMDGVNLSEMNLKELYNPDYQTIVINSCSRSFVFTGELHPSYLFWDYNYDFSAHRDTLPQKVSSYKDGQEMLRLQAIEAIKFWSV